MALPPGCATVYDNAREKEEVPRGAVSVYAFPFRVFRLHVYLPRRPRRAA